MDNVFFQSFLMISDVKTIVLLAVLAGLFYLIMNGVVTLVFGYLNRKLSYYKE